jgi:hypothetical protein
MSNLTLIQFYALNQKVILHHDEPEESSALAPNESPSLETRSLVLYLSSKYQLHDTKYFLARPELVKALLTSVVNRNDRIAHMESRILRPNFFKDEKIENVAQFFDLLTPEVKARIAKQMEDSSDCFICFDSHEADKLLIFQCGHGTCVPCHQKLESLQCPFCRQNITATQTHQHFHEQKVLHEQKQAEESKENPAEEKVEEGPKRPVWKFVADANDYLLRRMKSLLANNGTLSEKDATEFRALMDYDYDLFQSVCKSVKGIGSEEVRSLIAGEFYQRLVVPFLGKIAIAGVENPAPQALAQLANLLTTPNRLLRFLCYVKSKALDIDGQISAKFCGAMRRWLMAVIDQFPNDALTYEQFRGHQRIWKFLFKMMHAGEHKKCTQAQMYIKFVRDELKMPFQTPNGELTSLLVQNSEGIFDFLLTHPGLFYRHARRILTQFRGNAKLPQFLESMLPLLRQSQQMELLYVLDPAKAQGKVFINRKGGIHWPVQIHADGLEENKEDNEAREADYNEIVRIILTGLKTAHDDGTCIIDNRGGQLSNTLLKRGRPQKPVDWLGREPSKRGSSILMPTDQEILFFIYWKNGINGESVDLDLSLQGYGEDFSNQGECSFRNSYYGSAFNGATAFSGDIVDAPVGASEYIRLTLSDFKAKNPNVRYLTVNTMSYTGLAFEKMRESLVGVGVINPAVKGEGPHNSQVLDACRLEGNAQHNVGAYIDLKKNTMNFVNLSPSVKKKGRSHHLGNSANLVRDLLKNFMVWQETVSAPANYLYTACNFASKAKKVMMIDVDGSISVYNRHADEDTVNFLYRLGSKDDSDSLGSSVDLTQILEENVQYFGSPDQALAPGSVVVSSVPVTTQDLNQVTHLDEPYKLLRA